MQTTNEKDWTPREKELARAIRAQGNDVECRIESGRRVFRIVASENGERVTLHTGGGGAVRFEDTKPSLRVVRGVRG